MRRTLAAMMSAALLLLVMALPAAAHNITVTPHGTGEAKHGWTGSLGLPGQGKGLIPGGPGGAWLISPSHAKGLNTACYKLEANPSVVDIRGPGGPGCPHGS
jgi:hypothetical protein